jgi:putative serine protease PepD
MLPSSARARRSTVALVAVSALLGGALAATLTPRLGGAGRTTTIVRSVPAGVAPSSGNGLDAAAVYDRAAGGVVDVTASGAGALATGSGFVVGTQGRIVTAAHVVGGASSITVKLLDGSSVPGTLLGLDNATDVAVLRIDPAGLTLQPLTLGRSAALGIGDPVAAIGDPFQYERSLSTGIVSGLDRTMKAPNGFSVAHAIQTDAALNPGNSGGPLLDASGQVIGVVDQIATSGADQSSGVGFAVPIDLVAGELDALARGETLRHAYLGVSTGVAATGAAGALIGSVTAGSPAEAAHLHAGDLVTAFGGTAIKGASDLISAIAGRAPGDRITLTVLRDGATVHVPVTLGTQPATRTGP